ncbi:MAG TPA: hypothetical protein VIF82_10630 [Burkholderiaceae bacterium]
MKTGKLLFAALITSLVVTANAASFDCAKASNRIDNTICASPDISKLDSELDGTYKAALANSSDPDAIKAAQRAWLKSTRNQCQDETCFVTVYRQRISALSPGTPQQIMETKANTEADETAAKRLAEENAAKVTADAAKAEEQKTAELAAAAAQAKKTEEQAAANQVKKQADESAHAQSKQDSNDATSAKGGIALLILIAAIGYVIVQRKRKKNTTENALNKSLDLNKPISTIITEATAALKTETKKDIAEERQSNNQNIAWIWVKRNPIKSVLISIVSIIVIVPVDKNPSNHKITTILEAKSALSNATFEWQDKTALSIDIPVMVNRVTFDESVSTCSTSNRPITEDKFSEPLKGEVELSVEKYIDTGKPYVYLKCTRLGWPMSVDSNDKISIKYGQDDWWFAEKI